MEQIVKSQKEIEQEMLEMQDQFSAFLKTKGITAKLKLAFRNMSESAQQQKAVDRANFEAVKAQSMEDNKEFVEFLNAKGLKAKRDIVVENMKKNAAAAPANTAAQIAKIQAETQAQIAKANAYGRTTHTAESLTEEFSAYLKARGLEGTYSVVITEEE